MPKAIKVLAVVLAAVMLFAACSETGTDNDEAAEVDEETSSRQLSRYQEAQPVPEFDWSQIRQNLIEITTAQAQTTQTTSFFFNQGTDAPIGQCPSIGFPLPTTMQLTNPDSVVTPGPRERGTATVAQLEPSGVYTGESTGTYVMCIDGDGNAYAFYWEGFVSAVSGAAEFTNGQIRLIGEPTFDFSESE